MAEGNDSTLLRTLRVYENVNLILEEKVSPILQLLAEAQKMINSFITSVRERTKKNYTKAP